MITDFTIDLSRPPLYSFGDAGVVFEPWLWRCAFRLDGKKYIAALLQMSDCRNSRQAAVEFEKAIERRMMKKRKKPKY